MTNDIKTHRLIVTLPDTCGEDADAIAADIEAQLRAVSLTGWAIPGATVTHASEVTD